VEAVKMSGTALPLPNVLKIWLMIYILVPFTVLGVFVIFSLTVVREYGEGLGLFENTIFPTIEIILNLVTVYSIIILLKIEWGTKVFAKTNVVIMGIIPIIFGHLVGVYILLEFLGRPLDPSNNVTTYRISSTTLASFIRTSEWSFRLASVFFYEFFFGIFMMNVQFSKPQQFSATDSEIVRSDKEDYAAVAPDSDSDD